MSLLTPIFLLGALTIAIPILLHFTRHRPKNLTPFSAVIFLGPDRPTLRKRRHLENWPLLLLRCLILALLALAFARPFFDAPGTTTTRQADRRVILLLDTSASMSNSTGARTAAERILTNLPSNADLAVFTFARHPQLELDFDQWRAIPATERPGRIASLLENLPPTFATTNPGEALVAACDLLAASANPDPTTIHLISDFQETADFEATANIDWPDSVTVNPIRIPHDTDALPTLSLASATAGKITLIATNPGPATIAHLTPASPPPDATPQQLSVPPGTHTLTFDADLDATSYTASLDGIDSPFATSYVAQLRPPTLFVDYLGSDAASDSRQTLFYLTRALATPARFVTDLAVNTRRDNSFPLVATEFEPSAAASLRQKLVAGAHALLLLREPADARWIEALTSQPAQAAESTTTPFALLTAIDFTDPIFTPFADPRFSDFSKIHFWKHRTLTGPAVDSATSVARFDDGSPALLRVPVGSGSLLVLTTTWTPTDSQFAVSSKFVPFLISILESTASLPPDRRQYLVADSLPNGDPTTSPGIYSTPAFTYAVNTDPREANLTPLTEPAIVSLDLPTPLSGEAHSAAEDATRHLAREELESRSPLWQTILLATLAFILVETLLATRVQSEPEIQTSNP